MTAATGSIERGKIDIGRIIGDTFKVIGHNFPVFFVLSLVLTGLPSGAFSFLFTESGAMAETVGVEYFLWVLLLVLLYVAASAILQGALIYATIQDMNGVKPGLGETLATGLRAFLPLIGVSLLLLLAIMGGLILLIVPGIMMAVAWCVCAPALVAEHTGVMGAFRRSAALTRGNRWRIFGLVVFAWLAYMIFSTVLGVVASASLLVSGESAAALQTGGGGPLALVINILAQTLMSMVGAAGVAVLYVELRRVGDGLGPQALSEVFA